MSNLALFQWSASDFRPNFDFKSGITYIRIMAGAFYFPHVIYKILGFDASLVFFAKAGLEPALFFLILSLIVESTCGIGLLFGIMTRWIGLLSAGAMVVAAYATIAAKGMGWLWNKGGIEYLVYWAVVSLVLAGMAWRTHLAKTAEK